MVSTLSFVLTLIVIQSRQTKQDAELERVLKTLVAFVKSPSRRVSIPVPKESAVHLNWYDALKKEFKCIRLLWQAKKDLALVHDEIGILAYGHLLAYHVDMAVLRIRLCFEGEEILENERGWKLHPYDVDYMKTKLSTDKSVAETNLRKASGQLMYLRNLARLRADRGKDNPPTEDEMCPVSSMY